MSDLFLILFYFRFRRKYFHKTIFAILILIIILLLIGIIVLACLSEYLNSLMFYRNDFLFLIFLENNSNKDVCQTKECIRAASNLLETMNLKVDACEDFYEYSCGNWADEHPRPDSSSSYDWFTERQKRVLRNIREYLMENVTNDDQVPLPVKQSRIMYKACLDVGKHNFSNS